MSAFLFRSAVVAILALSLVACSREPAESSDSVAKKAGKAAHEIAVETKQAAKKVGKTIEKAAKEAHAGWKEAEQEDKAKKKK